MVRQKTKMNSQIALFGYFIMNLLPKQGFRGIQGVIVLPSHPHVTGLASFYNIISGIVLGEQVSADECPSATASNHINRNLFLLQYFQYTNVSQSSSTTSPTASPIFPRSFMFPTQ